MKVLVLNVTSFSDMHTPKVLDSPGPMLLIESNYVGSELTIVKGEHNIGTDKVIYLAKLLIRMAMNGFVRNRVTWGYSAASEIYYIDIAYLLWGTGTISNRVDYKLKWTVNRRQWDTVGHFLLINFLYYSVLNFNLTVHTLH